MCQDATLQDGASITRLEVSYKNDIRQLIWQDSTGKTYQIGRMYTGDKTYEWDFNDANRFTGLQGQSYQDRLSKIGVLVYRPECGDKAIYEYQVLGDIGEKNEGIENASAMQQIK